MRVLMFGWEFPPYISGGLGTACFGLTRAMAALNTEILFILPRAQEWQAEAEVAHFELMGADQVDVSLEREDLIEQLSDETVEFVEVDSALSPYMTEESYRERLVSQTTQLRISGPGTQMPEGKVAPPVLYGTGLLAEVSRYALVGRRLAEEKEFDVIHAHDWMTYLAGAEAKKVSGKPLVCHVHATEYDRTIDEPNAKIEAIERYGLNEADLVITVSERTRKMVMRCYDLDPDKVVVVHNAVSKEKLLSSTTIKRNLDEKMVLFLGRVTIQKGPDYFLEAARLVLDELPNVRFVMAGAGDLLPHIIERVAELRLQEHFHFTGFLSRTDVERIFGMTDLYVMPSVSEPFGITPFEATLHRIPVIVSRQSGVNEVLEHAVKVDFWDVHEMARSIIDLLCDESKAADMSRRGEEVLAGISWEKVAGTVLKHYARLTGGGER